MEIRKIEGFLCKNYILGTFDCNEINTNLIFLPYTANIKLFHHQKVSKMG